MDNTANEVTAQNTDIQLKFSTKFSYGLGDMASNLSWGMVTTYLLYFYTDVFKLSAVAVGTLFLVARLWDAVNDPIMGYLADRTRSRWGRFRPYILFGSILLAVFTVLCFTAPNLNGTPKLIYAYVTYIALGMSYTAVNMPYGAITASMTQNADERSSLSGFRVFFAAIGTIIVSSATLPLVQAFDSGSGHNGYFIVAIIYAVLMLPLYFIVFKKTREVVEPQVKRKNSLKDIVLVIIKNKPLLLIMLATLFSSVCLFIKQAMLIYYFNYVAGKPDMTAMVLGLMALMMIIGIVIAAPVSKKLGNKKITMLIGICASCVASFGLYFTGPSNTAMIYVWILFSAMFMGLISVMLWSMTADTIEYGEWKTGIRADGVIYSSASFVQKLGTAIAGWGGALILAVTGYVPDSAQSNATVSGINFSITLLPGIMLAVSIIPLLFYKLDRKKYYQILEEIKSRSSLIGNI